MKLRKNFITISFKICKRYYKNIIITIELEVIGMKIFKDFFDVKAVIFLYSLQ